MNNKFHNIVLVDALWAAGVITKEQADKAITYLLAVPSSSTLQAYLDKRQKNEQ